MALRGTAASGDIRSTRARFERSAREIRRFPGFTGLTPRRGRARALRHRKRVQWRRSRVFPLNENVSIDAFFGYRVMVVSSVDGVEVDDDLTAGGWMLKLGPALFF